MYSASILLIVAVAALAAGLALGYAAGRNARDDDHLREMERLLGELRGSLGSKGKGATR